jgi:hypothetical protein
VERIPGAVGFKRSALGLSATLAALLLVPAGAQAAAPVCPDSDTRDVAVNTPLPLDP